MFKDTSYVGQNNVRLIIIYNVLRIDLTCIWKDKETLNMAWLVMSAIFVWIVKLIYLFSLFSSVSNGSIDDEDASSKENCETASGQISDGPSSNALLSSDGNLKNKKKGMFFM